MSMNLTTDDSQEIVVGLTEQNDEVRSSRNILNEESVRVYVDYDIRNLPESPGEGWTRFICMSDTHGRGCFVPPGDVLLHAGDVSHRGTADDLKLMLDWLAELPHQFKIVIAGNHDFVLDRSSFPYSALPSGWNEQKIQDEMDSAEEILKYHVTSPGGVIYLQDSEYDLNVGDTGHRWSVFGSPWTPAFSETAFKYPTRDAEAVIKQFQKTDILITHGPPFGFLDTTTKGTHAGCPALLEGLSHLRPVLHVFGHIHEARGAVIRKWPPNPSPEDVATNAEEAREARTVFVNASTRPSGPNSTDDNGRHLKVGEKGWRPVIVDMHQEFR